jgi:hypothetical protein
MIKGAIHHDATVYSCPMLTDAIAWTTSRIVAGAAAVCSSPILTLFSDQISAVESCRQCV